MSKAKVQPECFCSFLTDFDRAKSMHYLVTIVDNVISGNVINLLAMAIASVSFLVSKHALRCQRDN